MLPEQQQRILGYFIEEAKEHLNTIEQGLLNLQTTLQDSEMMNEIFRAAHSIKGGAAMLGLNSIQRTAHRLEDFFKALKECLTIQIDRKLESLFLQVFDTLQALLQQLESSAGLTEDQVNHLMSKAEPIFLELQQHLELLVNQAGGSMQPEEISLSVAAVAPESRSSKISAALDTGLPVFQSTVMTQLRQMLQLFKQPETPQTRQQLEECCHQLKQQGAQFNSPGWCSLCETAADAIANPDNSYQTLAPIIIKELKQAQELVLAGREAEVATCEQLQTLAIATFLFDWEDTGTSLDPENHSLDEMMAIAEPEPPIADLAALMANAQVPLIDASIEAEDDLSSLFTFNLDEDELLSPGTLDHSGTNAKESLPPISADQTLALDSLFGDVEDPALNFTTPEEDLAFCDLFGDVEAAGERHNVAAESTPTASADNANLSVFWQEDSEASAPIQFELEEVSFPSQTEEERLAASPETSGFSVNSLEVTDVDPIEIALSNSGEQRDAVDDPWDVELALDWTSVLGSSSPVDSAELGETARDVLPAISPEITAELDLNLESTEIDFFKALSEESEQSLDLLFETDDAPAKAIASDLTAAFELTTEEEEFELDIALDDESAGVMNVADMTSESELLNQELTVEVDSQLAAATAGVETEDFAELEALLAEASAAVESVVEEPPLESVDNQFGDLEKLLAASNPKTETVMPVQPQSQPTATNVRRPAFEQMMRVPVKHLDNISNLVGELVVYRNSLEQDQERLRQFLDNLLHQVQQLGDVGARMQELYERSLLEASLLNSRRNSDSASSDNAASEHHATGMNFDALEMDRFTGFHMLAQEMIELIVRVREASSDMEFVSEETEQVTRQFRQVTTRLQEGLTRSRMVPFSQIADRLPRAVRDISLKYGKQVELHIEGQDVLIDKMILEQLYDPMTHLVNNAITHGIETSEERLNQGKTPVGQITIRAFHQGNQTVITVSDDGAGIDAERVKAKAIQKSLITPDLAENMSRLDVYNLLFHAGFTTKDQVDEFAGRGVGMDVVLTSLNQIRGAINTDSALGKGTTFTIRLPLTLSICKALCCLSDKAQIAFPMDGVEQMLELPVESTVTNAEGQACIPWRNSLLPFRPLKELITYNRQLSRGNVYGSNQAEDIISIVVLRAADAFLALQVDQVLGEQEIVIKQFEAPAPKPVGIAGATVLGDGRIMPIADVLELMDLAMGRVRQDGKGMLWTQRSVPVLPQIPIAVKGESVVLIVDDSITVRELLSMTFSNAGYRVEQARDGQEAWNKLRDGLPCDLVFCDIEMPRMDGLELLSRMQEDPRLSELPIAMLTSRGSERHRQMALQLGASGYFTKPYLEEALLDGAQRMLRGEVLVTSM